VTIKAQVNEAPIAQRDSGTGDENESVLINVLANDTDANDPINFTLDSVTIIDVDGDVETGHGQVSIVNNQLQFVPGNALSATATGPSLVPVTVMVAVEVDIAPSLSDIT
jgi:hypothetical protein